MTDPDSDGHDWWPLRYLPPLLNAGPPDQYAVITLNHPTIASEPVYAEVYNSATITIAADGGANAIHARGLTAPHVLAGDLDSVRPDVRAHCEGHGTRVVQDRDELQPDFAKALAALRADAHAPQCAAALVFGGLAGRADQAFSQLHQLYAAAAAAAASSTADGAGGRQPPVYLVAGANVIFALRAGRNVVHLQRGAGSAAGRCAGVIPLGRPAVVSIEGLWYEVRDWATSFGTRVSTSNYVVRDDVVVTTDVAVLFCIDMELPPLGGEEPAGGPP